jgi:hypothetical protein
MDGPKQAAPPLVAAALEAAVEVVVVVVLKLRWALAAALTQHAWPL